MGSGAAFTSFCRCVFYAWIAYTVLASSAFASPWARIDGELLIISSVDYFHADLSSQDPANQETTVGSFESFDNDTYVEYGLTDSFTIGGKAVYGVHWLNNSAGSFTDSGFSEIEAFAQYELLRTIKHAASVRVSAGKPSSFQSSVRTSLNNGVDTEVAALYGRNISHAPIKIFTAGEVGYRKRFGDAADVVRAQATIGIEPGKRWVLLLENFATVSLRNERFDGADYDVVKIQPSVVYRFNRRWAVQAGASKDIFTRDVASGRTYFIGLWSVF